MPLQMGVWHGKEVKLDPKLFVATEAASALTRSYSDAMDRMVSVFTAIYTNPDAGVYHSPLNCYQSQGWTKLSEDRVPLTVPGRPTVQVDLSLWDRGGDRVYVLFWYELGEHVLFERYDLGKVRVAMRGRAEWPPLVKVLMQTSAVHPEAAKSQIIELARLRAAAGCRNSTLPRHPPPRSST